MKRILAFAALCLNIACFAQSGVRYDGRVTVAGTNVPSNANVPLMGVPNASVTICTDGTCTANQPIFSNQGINVPTSNPIKTDGQGRFGFYAAAGSYFYKVQLPSGNIQGIFPITLGGAGGGSVTPSISVAATSSSGVVQTATPSAVAGLFGCSSGQALGAGGTCIAPGTPVGTQYRIGAYTGSGSGASTQLGLTNSFTDATLNPLTVPGALAGKTTNGRGNTDLNGGMLNAITLCGTAPCDYDAPSNSTDTANVFFSINPSDGNHYMLRDNRGGRDVKFAVGIQPTNFYAQTAFGNNCIFPLTGTPGDSSHGASIVICNQNNFIKVGGGISTDATWTNIQADGANQFFNTRGQSFSYARNTWFMKTGDSIQNELQYNFRGGCIGASDECNKLVAWHADQWVTSFGQVAVAGAGAGPSFIQVNMGSPTQNGRMMDGGYLFDIDQATDAVTTYSSCTNIGDLIPQLCTTATSHTSGVDTWEAVLTADCGVDNIRNVKTPTVCSVNVTRNSTAPTVGKAVAIADVRNYEGAMVSAYSPTGGGTGAQSITLNLSTFHRSGTMINFGTLAGSGAMFAPDGVSDVTTATNDIVSGWPIGGAPDATHEYIMVNYKQNVEGSAELPIPFSPSTSIVVAGTCTGAGLVTFPALASFVPGLNATPHNQQNWVVSGNSVTAANGVVTSVFANGDGSGGWTAPGASCAGNPTATGTITLTHTQDVYTYCAAEVTAILGGEQDGQGNLASDGNINLDGSNCNFALNDRIMQPNRVETEIQLWTDETSVNTPNPSGNNVLVQHQISGLAWSSIPLNSYVSVNGQSSNNQWYDLGGPVHASPVNEYKMPVSSTIFDAGMENGKAMFDVRCPLLGCNATMADNTIFQMAGNAGGGVFVWQGAHSQFLTFNPFIFRQGWDAENDTSYEGNVKLVFKTIFNSPQKLGECNAFAVSGKFCWGSNPTSGTAQDGQMEMGTFQTDVIHGLTGFNGTTQVPVCLLDGTDCPSGGGGGLTGQVTGFLPVAATATTSTGPSPIDYGVTTSGVVTSSAPMAINSATTPSSMLYVPNGVSPAVTTGAAGWGVQSGAITGGFYEMPAAPCSGLLNLTNTSGIVVTNCVTAAGGSTGAQGVMQEAGATAGSFQAGAITEGTSTLVSTKAIQANLTGSATAVNFATDALGTGMFSTANTNLQFSLNGTQGSSLTTAGWFLKTGVNCWGSSFTACSAGIGISSSNSYLNAYNSVTTGTAPTNSMATLFDFHAISTVASATTIAPTGSIINVSGTTAIATITPPTGISTTLGTCIDIMPTGVFTFTTGGNISNPTAVTPAVGTPIRACWFGTAWAIK